MNKIINNQRHILQSDDHLSDLFINPPPDKIIQHNLSPDMKSFNLYPRAIDIMPFTDTGFYNLQLYSHVGEEFIFVLEGVLTLIIEEEEYILYPGDSTTFDSTKPHNWKNETNCITKIICVHNPNPFKNI